jgi:hypothetical protein
MYDYLYREGRCESEFLRDGIPNSSCRSLEIRRFEIGGRTVWFVETPELATLVFENNDNRGDRRRLRPDIVTIETK